MVFSFFQGIWGGQLGGCFVIFEKLWVRGMWRSQNRTALRSAPERERESKTERARKKESGLLPDAGISDELCVFCTEKVNSKQTMSQLPSLL